MLISYKKKTDISYYFVFSLVLGFIEKRKTIR